MKKRLLITSIVMMLVVAVALSTATYAWFTSNANVKATAVVLTASTADGDAIMISHAANNTGIMSTISLTTMTEDGRLYPATPKANTAFTTDLDAAIAVENGEISDSLDAAFQNLIMKGAGNYVDPEISGDNVSYYTDTVYVYNKGTVAKALAPTIKIYYTTADESTLAAKSVRIALIERVGTEATAGADVTFGNYTLRGIYQYGVEANDYEAVEENDEFVATSNYYYTYNAETNIYTVDSTVTSENFADKKSTLYVVSATKKMTTAVAGANSAYGANETAQGSGIFTQASVAFSPNTTFATIAVPTSGHYVCNSYTVVIWLEGWDIDCTNSITQGQFSVGIDFSVAA